MLSSFGVLLLVWFVRVVRACDPGSRLVLRDIGLRHNRQPERIPNHPLAFCFPDLG